MILLGVVLMVVGFGSLILQPMDLGFLDWAEDVQPALGLVVGLLGVVLVVSGIALRKKRAREASGKPGVGEWAGDGYWAGSSPSAPQTTGPLTGGRASGELQADVEPTGLESSPEPVDVDQEQRSGTLGAVPAGGATGPGQVGGKYREPVPAKPAGRRESSPSTGSTDRYDGAPTIRRTDDREAPEPPAAHPDKGKSSRPDGGRQQAGAPGPHQPDELKPRRGDASYEDAVDQSAAEPDDRPR